MDNDDAYSDLNNSNTYIFAKKESGYLCVYLNKKNKSLIKQKGILVSLPLINIISGEATLLRFSKRIIIYTIDTEGETHTLNFNKVQYLLNGGINIFRAKKLLGKSHIQIKDKNLVVNKEGLSIFRFNKNIIITKAPCIYIFPTVIQKKPLETLI